MEVIKSISQMQQISDRIRANDKKIALVPTMGFLHEGHLSLIRKGKKEGDVLITSLFVNPTQFAPNEDFDEYPKDFERDFELSENAGSDYLFYPSVREMYPKGYDAVVHIGKITNKFEGEKRPTHFDGVSTVVTKLFLATKPHIAIFGQKDYQQSLLIKKLVKDLNFDIDIIISPIIRESDGLAMSSRNTYLSPENRKKAGILFIALEEAKHSIEKGETDRKTINAIMHKTLRQEKDIRIDYASAVNADDLSEPENFFPKEKIVLLLACYLGSTRLIDNAIVTVPEQLNPTNF